MKAGKAPAASSPALWIAPWIAPWTTWLVIALVLGGMSSQLARADDFRILSRVYVGEEEEPASETTTVFRGGLVYDWSGASREVVLFDPARGRFVMLDPQHKLRAEVTVQQIDGLVPVMQEKLARRKAALTAFLLDPTFQTDEQSGEATFTSDWVAYRVKTLPAKNDAVARQYAAFSASYTRLNTLKHPKLLARVPVNTWLNQRKLIPGEVHLTTYKQGLLGRRTVDATYRSQHLVTWGLSSEDLKRIERIERWLVEFRHVGPSEYWQARTSDAGKR